MYLKGDPMEDKGSEYNVEKFFFYGMIWMSETAEDFYIVFPKTS